MEAFKLGLLIALMPALAFALIDQVYVNYINPDFYEQYYAYSLEQVKLEKAGTELEEAIDELESQKAMFANSGFQFIIMFMTVFLIGFIVTIISGLYLKRTAPVTSTSF